MAFRRLEIALQGEIPVGRALDVDDLDALGGRRAFAAKIDDAYRRIAGRAALDDEPVGGGTVAAQIGVDQQRAILASIVAVYRQCFELMRQSAQSIASWRDRACIDGRADRARAMQIPVVPHVHGAAKRAIDPHRAAT